MHPRIVVACGVWNEQQYLHETIPAMLAQTMPDFALVLHDNGSTDATWDILQEYARLDARITLRRSAVNLRCPDAANDGWALAMARWPECRWFMGQGGDDLMDADYLEAILAAADAHPDVNCIFSPAKFIGTSGVWRYPRYDPKKVHIELQVPGWRAFTRELWDATGPEWTGINEGSDWEWVCRASVKGVLRPYQLDTPKLARRIRQDRKSQSDMADKPFLLDRLRAMVTA